MATLIPKIKLSSGSQQSPSVVIGNSGIYSSGSGMSVVVGSSTSLSIDDKGIKVPTGSSTGPSLSFISSTNSGMFLSPSGPSISIEGSQVALFTSNGMILPTGSLTITNPIVAYRPMGGASGYSAERPLVWTGASSIDTSYVTFDPTTNVYFSPSQTGYYSINANIDIATTVTSSNLYTSRMQQVESPSNPTAIGGPLSFLSIAPTTTTAGITIPLNDILNLQGGSWYMIKAGRSVAGTFNFATSYLRIIKLF